MSARPYWGKYRSAVTDNVDPLGIGRLKAKVPDVLGDQPSTWAMPCLPMTGQAAGIYAVPPVGAGVWIEFEQGDPNKPIWCGGFWGSQSEVPPDATKGKPNSPSLVLQTSGGHVFALSDAPGPTGGILIKLAGGAKIAVNDVGITIDNGKGASITLNGATVSVNGGALAVT